jgi:Flp pilus assembly pilin Flp
MRYLKNENGVALVTALLLTLISLVMVMAVLYFVTQGIKVSAANKSYRSALDASYGGGGEFFPKDVLPQLVKNFNNYSSTSTATAETLKLFSSTNMQFSASGCLSQKMSISRVDWTACGAGNKTLDPKSSPDVTFRLKGGDLLPGFNVFAKIVDTIPGNSDPSTIDYLSSGAGVTGTSSGVSPKHLPATYRIEVQGERETNPQEKAQLSVLYAY